MITFFSIVIPTFNRNKELLMAVKSVLRQDFNNFEIVISDNASSKDPLPALKKLKDRRIKYFRNDKNIYFARNLYKAIKLATGKYVFILGDDDLILEKGCLSRLYSLIKKTQVGYIRMGFVFYMNDDLSNLFLRSSFKDTKKPQLINLKVKNYQIIKYLYNSQFGFMSGVVFKNDPKIHILELEKTKDDKFQMEYFWLKFIFPALKKYGGVIDNESLILATWSVYYGSHFYDVVDNKIYLENGWRLFFNRLTPNEQKKWAKEQTEWLIPLLPSIKFHSSNTNLWKHINRSIELNSDLLKNPQFYFYALVAFLMPKFVWRTLRKFYFRFNEYQNKQISRAIVELKKDID